LEHTVFVVTRVLFIPFTVKIPQLHFLLYRAVWNSQSCFTCWRIFQQHFCFQAVADSCCWCNDDRSHDRHDWTNGRLFHVTSGVFHNPLGHSKCYTRSHFARFTGERFFYLCFSFMFIDAFVFAGTKPTQTSIYIHFSRFLP